jgi:hypothetical protein
VEWGASVNDLLRTCLGKRQSIEEPALSLLIANLKPRDFISALVGSTYSGGAVANALNVAKGMWAQNRNNMAHDFMIISSRAYDG